MAVPEHLHPAANLVTGRPSAWFHRTETGARPPNCKRCFRLDSPFVPDDRFPSLSCHSAQHSECQLWVANRPVADSWGRASSRWSLTAETGLLAPGGRSATRSTACACEEGVRVSSCLTADGRQRPDQQVWSAHVQVCFVRFASQRRSGSAPRRDAATKSLSAARLKA
jgi:hypothetical protein